MLSLKEQHERMLYPEVRVRSGKAMGSGTILYSAPLPESDDGRHETYILTNEHVVDDLIKVETKWSALLKRERKVDVLGTPSIEVFTYDFMSRVIGGTMYQTDIVCYDKDEDLALLRVRAPNQFPHVAEMYPRAEVDELKSFMPVVTVGCGLGAKPVITFGYISGFGYEIENRDFVLMSAASIFGNSGGATFLLDTGQFIGVPSRLAVNWGDAITHCSYSIPVWRVYQFLEDQVFHFVFDDSVTSAECEEMRRAKRENEEYQMLAEDRGKN